MYHNFIVVSDFDLHTDYDSVFGKYVGNIFAKTMEDCFYLNPILEDERYYYGIALDNIMTLPQYLGAVHATYALATSAYPKSGLSGQFKLYDNVYRRFPKNSVRVETIDDKRCFCYRNMCSNVAQAIIFGAYFLAAINSEISPEIEPTRDFLLEYLRDMACLNEKAFKSKHIASYLYKQYFEPTLRKIVEKTNQEETAMPTSGTKGQETDASDQTITKLNEEIASLKKEIEGYKENIHPAIPENYIKSVDSVFLPTYRLYDKEIPVYQKVRETGRSFLDPNEPTLVPIFINACISMNCARASSLMYPKKIVEALIGLGALQLCADQIKLFTDSVSRKINRLRDKKMTDDEESYYYTVVTALKKNNAV